MVKGQRLGYVRVSTVDQNTARQLAGLELDKVFTDRTSGKSMKRPELIRLLEFAREGDTVVVHSLDRLGRDLFDLLGIIKGLNGKGVAVEVVSPPLRFFGDETTVANMYLGILGTVAQFERALVRERQREGIAIAKAAGKYTGRRPAVTPEQVGKVRELIAAGMPLAKAARVVGVNRSTMYHYLKDPVE